MRRNGIFSSFFFHLTSYVLFVLICEMQNLCLPLSAISSWLWLWSELSCLMLEKLFLEICRIRKSIQLSAKDLSLRCPIEIWDHAIAFFLLTLQEETVVTSHSDVLVFVKGLSSFLKGFSGLRFWGPSAWGLARATPESKMTPVSLFPKVRLWQCEGEDRKTATTEPYLVALTKIKISVHGSCLKPWVPKASCDSHLLLPVPSLQMVCVYSSPDLHGLLFFVLCHFSPSQKSEFRDSHSQGSEWLLQPIERQVTWMRQQIFSRQK